MDYIKILLLIYLVLRIINFLPCQKFPLNNPYKNTIVILLLILLVAHDPVMCLLVIVSILVNVSNQHTENSVINIYKDDIENIKSTFTQKKQKKQEEQTKVVTKQQEKTKNDECVPEFIISKKMLDNAQNNIVDNANVHKFPNEIQEEHVNIQGIFEDVSGYNV
uniref:Uncharacterized protein n=1 Tax=Pyramimonas orientalis virus TaxID=455367 RepID=A0A7L9AYT0_POV01|nr:hypothetical protein HWQ62_00284 [Pyramimonas orientalis virus]